MRSKLKWLGMLLGIILFVAMVLLPFGDPSSRGGLLSLKAKQNPRSFTIIFAGIIVLLILLDVALNKRKSK